MVETSTGQATATMDTAGEKIADKVLMYACIFTYEKPKVRSGINNFVCTTNSSFKSLENDDQSRITRFVTSDPDKQREFLD